LQQLANLARLPELRQHIQELERMLRDQGGEK